MMVVGDLAMIGIDNERCSMQSMDGVFIYITAHDVAFEQSANVKFCRNGGISGFGQGDRSVLRRKM